MKCLRDKKKSGTRLYVGVYIAVGSGEQLRQVACRDWLGVEMALMMQGFPRPRWVAEEVEAG